MACLHSVAWMKKVAANVSTPVVCVCVCKIMFELTLCVRQQQQSGQQQEMQQPNAELHVPAAL